MSSADARELAVAGVEAPGELRFAGRRGDGLELKRSGGILAGVKLFFGLVACVAVLQIAAAIGLAVAALDHASFDPAAEFSYMGTLALLLGSAVHYARRGTVVPPRPLLAAGAVLLAAPLIAVVLGAEAVAAWEPERFAAESGFVAFQVVGLWIVGGVLFGGPFACSERQDMPEHQVRLRPASRLIG